MPDGDLVSTASRAVSIGGKTRERPRLCLFVLFDALRTGEHGNRDAIDPEGSVSPAARLGLHGQRTIDISGSLVGSPVVLRQVENGTARLTSDSGAFVGMLVVGNIRH